MGILSKTSQALEQGLEQGLHIGAQLYASIDGHPIADLALGRARLATAPAADPDLPHHRDVPMSTDTLMLWLSAGKPITAIAIAMLWEQRKLTLDEPVATYWPEFAQNGKAGITIRHLLTHTSGIRGLDTAYPFATWEETVGKIAAMKPERGWIPGLKVGYHTHTSWYVLGELIRRLTGAMPDIWIRKNLLVPLGMKETWLAMSPEQYENYGVRIGYLYDTTESPPIPLPNYDTELAASRPRPSASFRGPVRELARFYEMLRRGGELEGTRFLRHETVEAITTRQRVGLYDQTFQRVIDWGLGVIINSSHYQAGTPYQFGPYASRDTFGHGGSQSSTGFCNPRHKLVVSLMFNGCPGEAAHDLRLRSPLKALYEDLGLA
jgi:CubicO group peptidase (beta-lactamase class C family)